MLRRLAIILIGIVAAVLVLGAGVAQVPILSSVFGMNHARDLGMPRDRVAFEQFADKYGITRPSDPANYTLSSKHHWSGSVAVDDTLSEAAIGSLREFNTPNSMMKDLQFRVHPGFVEVAAFVNVPGYPISDPMYGQFSITRLNSHAVTIQISQLDFGRFKGTWPAVITADAPNPNDVP
jgi:hypothetical protein